MSPKKKNDETWYTYRETAALLNVGFDHVRKLVSEGRIKSQQLSEKKQCFISESEVKRYTENRYELKEIDDESYLPTQETKRKRIIRKEIYRPGYRN